jgi:hypothetical protein
MRRLGFLCLAALLVSNACNQVPPLSATTAQVRAVETLFPLIEELHVDAYWVDDECRYFHYPRGSFSNDTSVDGSCRVWDYPDPEGFDTQANHDIDRLITAIRDAHAGVSYMSIEPSGVVPGGVGSGSWFGIGPCDNLVYDPGSVDFPGQPVEVDVPGGEIRSPVTPDWYEDVSAC